MKRCVMLLFLFVSFTCIGCGEVVEELVLDSGKKMINEDNGMLCSVDFSHSVEKTPYDHLIFSFMDNWDGRWSGRVSDFKEKKWLKEWREAEVEANKFEIIRAVLVKNGGRGSWYMKILFTRKDNIKKEAF